MSGHLRGLARGQLELALADVGLAGGEGDGHHHHPEVDDHPAVGPAHQPPPAVAAHGRGQASQGRAGGQPAQPEGQQRGPAPGPGRHRGDDGPSPDPGRGQQPPAQRLGPGGPAPGQHRPHRHQEQQGQSHRPGHAVEVGVAHRDGAAVHGLDDQREHGAQQHDEGEHGEGHVVGQESGLAGQGRVDAPLRAELVAPPGDEPQRRHHHHGEEAGQGRADGRLGEGVHGVEHPRTGDEGAEDGEREGGHHQRQVPHPQQASALLRGGRVQVGGAGEPGQEGGVLHRVPGPVAAPAQSLVAPPGPEHDAQRQETPGHQGPAAGGGQPVLAQAAGGQGGDGEGEGHGEPHVAEVQHRRVEGHEDVVLEQGVGAGAVVAGGRVEADEGRGRAGHEGEEEGGHGEQHQQGPAHGRVGASAAEPQRHRGGESAQHQGPQQDRSLQGPPQGGEVEDGGGGRGAVVGHVLHREVAGDESPFHDGEGGDGGQDHGRHQPAGGSEPVGGDPGQAEGGDQHPGGGGGQADDHGGAAEGDVAQVAAPCSASSTRSS